MPEPRANQGPAATALRLAGASYHEIAEAVGFPSANAARTAVEATLATRIGDPQTREQLRAEEAGRLERLLRSVWGKATTPDHSEHLPAVKVAVALIDRHIRLFGLDAPHEITIHTPTTAEIDQWVANVTGAQISTLAELEQGVVIDAEIVEEPIDA